MCVNRFILFWLIDLRENYPLKNPLKNRLKNQNDRMVARNERLLNHPMIQEEKKMRKTSLKKKKRKVASSKFTVIYFFRIYEGSTWRDWCRNYGERTRGFRGIRFVRDRLHAPPLLFKPNFSDNENNSRSEEETKRAKYGKKYKSKGDMLSRPPQELTPAQEAEIKEAFSIFDENGNGTIGPQEIKHVLKAVGMST